MFTFVRAESVLIWGRVKYGRVERQGGTALLGKGMLEMGYWSMQPVGRALVFFNFSPHVITWTSLGFGIGAGIALANGRFGLGAVLGTVSAFLDTLDGMVARLKGIDSNKGGLLDSSVDRYSEFFFLAGLIMYYREIPVLMALGLAGIIGSFMVSYSTAKAEGFGVQAPKTIMRRPERAFYLILGAALAPLSIRWLETPDLYPVAIGFPVVASMIMVGVLSNIVAVHRLFGIVDRIREKERRVQQLAIQSNTQAAQSQEVKRARSKLPSSADL